MSSTIPSAEDSQPPTILKPYAPDPNKRSRRVWRGVILAAVIVFCLFYGLAFAFLAPFLMMMFVIPIGILTFMVIWALPESRAAPTGALVGLLFAFLAGLVMWPEYLALSLPGLPWITLVRLIGGPMAIVLLLCVSMSRQFRTQLWTVLRNEPVILWLNVAFVGLEFMSIPLSKSIFFSLDKFITAQMAWTAVFFASCYVFAKPGRVKTFAYLMWFMTIPIGLIAIDEFMHQRVFWAGHVPSFLQIQDEAVMRILAGTMRAYTDRYRAQSVFTTSLGLAEYLALAVPFVLHFLGGDFKPRVRWMAAASLPFLLVIVLLTNARLGFIGFCLSFLFYLFFWGVRRWQTERMGLFGPFIVLSYPALFVGFLATTFFVGRLHRLVWGGGQFDASTNARVDQLKMGMPIVAHNPFGHGMGRAAETLGYYQPGGLLTIDSYYLSVLLEYGVLGFLVFYGLIAMAIYRSGQIAFTNTKLSSELSFLVPVSIALTNFLIVKSVLSQQDNHSIVFMLFGILVGSSYINKTGGLATPVEADRAVVSRR